MLHKLSAAAIAEPTHAARVACNLAGGRIYSYALCLNVGPASEQITSSSDSIQEKLSFVFIDVGKVVRCALYFDGYGHSVACNKLHRILLPTGINSEAYTV